MTYTEERPSARWTIGELRATGLTEAGATRVPASLAPRPGALGGGGAGTGGSSDAVVDQLDRLARLGPGWVEDGGRPIAAEVLGTVRAFLGSELVGRTPSKPQLVPTFEGGVQMEWHTQDVDFIIECSPSQPPSFYVSYTQSGKEVEGPVLEGQEAFGEAFLALGLRI